MTQWKMLQQMEQELTAERKAAFMTTQKEAAEPKLPLLWYPPAWDETDFDPAGDNSIQNLERDSHKPERLYMPCAKRLQWFHQDQRKVQAEALKAGRQAPVYTVKTEPVILEWEQGVAVFKTIIDDCYGNHVEDYGSSTRAAWSGGFIEKASTKSLSRALAKLGYGTQFALDYDEDEPDLADTPQTRPQQPKLQPKAQPQKEEAAQSSSESMRNITMYAISLGYDTQAKREAAWNSFKTGKALPPGATPADFPHDFQAWLKTHPYQPEKVPA